MSGAGGNTRINSSGSDEVLPRRANQPPADRFSANRGRSKARVQTLKLAAARPRHPPARFALTVTV
jgi:hypothetical protein